MPPACFMRLTNWDYSTIETGSEIRLLTRAQKEKASSVFQYVGLRFQTYLPDALVMHFRLLRDFRSSCYFPTVSSIPVTIVQ